MDSLAESEIHRTAFDTAWPQQQQSTEITTDRTNEFWYRCTYRYNGQMHAGHSKVT